VRAPPLPNLAAGASLYTLRAAKNGFFVYYIKKFLKSQGLIKNNFFVYYIKKFFKSQYVIARLEKIF